MAPPPSTTAASESTSRRVIGLGTRKSPLAMVQAHAVRDSLKEIAPQYDYEIKAINTMGDKNKEISLQAFNAKSLWTQELETMLEEREIDVIVHCLKDIPTQIPTTCTLGAILRREDPRDAVVFPKNSPPSTTLRSLPAGSVVGTSSVRRTAQLARQYPHLSFQPCRGNIDTRLSKVDAEGGQYAAIVIAAAGLIRMGWRSRISAFLSSKTVDAEGDAPDQSEVAEAPPAAHGNLEKGAESGPSDEASSVPDWGMLHAVGQGALALEVRVGDDDIMSLIKPLNDPESALACLAERSLMRTLEGGCSVPIGVETSWGDAPDEVDLTFKAVVVSVDGKQAAAGQLTKRIGTVEESDEFGRDMARLLLERGAGPILNDITLDRNIIQKQGDA